MSSQKKIVSSLDSLAQTYSDRKHGDLAILEGKAQEIPALVASFLAGLANHQYVEDEVTIAIVALLGPDAVRAYLDSSEAFDRLAAIRDREAVRGGVEVHATETTKEKEPTLRVTHPPATTSPAPTSNGSIPSIADKLNRTALAGVPVDLRTGAGSWNYYTAKKLAGDAAKASASFGAKKLERFLLALEGERTWKGVVEVSRKAGLPILTAEKAS